MGGSDCEDLTSDSIARLAQYFLVLAGHIGVACYVGRLLVRTTSGLRGRRRRGGQCSYVLSTLGCAIVGNGAAVASCIFGICDMLTLRIDFDDAVVLETSLDALAAIAVVCCFLNVGLFWIEIAVASKRLSLHTSNNLRRTWWVTLGYIALFTLGEMATLAVFISTSDVEVTNFHQALIGLSALLIMVVYLCGATELQKLHARDPRRSSLSLDGGSMAPMAASASAPGAGATAAATSAAPSGPRPPSKPQPKPPTRLAAIVRSSRRVGAAAALSIVGAAVDFLATSLRSASLLWCFRVLVHLGVVAALVEVASFVGGVHAEAAARRPPRVSVDVEASSRIGGEDSPSSGNAAATALPPDSPSSRSSPPKPPASARSGGSGSRWPTSPASPLRDVVHNWPRTPFERSLSVTNEAAEHCCYGDYDAAELSGAAAPVAAHAVPPPEVAQTAHESAGRLARI